MMPAKEVAQEAKCLLWKWMGMRCISRNRARLSAVTCSSSRVHTEGYKADRTLPGSLQAS